MDENGLISAAEFKAPHKLMANKIFLFLFFYFICPRKMSTLMWANASLSLS